MAAIASLDRADLERFVRWFEAAFYARDAAGMAAYYTDDARLMAENVSEIRGRAGIGEFWRMTCERAAAIGMKRAIRVDDVQLADALGYAVCTLTLELPGADGATIVRTVKDITIWRRLADGTWQIEVDISNPNPP